MAERGMAKSEIARRLGVSRSTVKDIVSKAASGEAAKPTPRKNAIVVAPELLTQVYKRCQGYRQRIWEVLQDEHKIDIGYSTLTRRIRELGLEVVVRASRVPDEPGVEMQHDTSPHTVMVGGVKMKVTTVTLYFRYSKQIFIRFYRSFDRFKMKSFFHEALTHYGYAAEVCIIDNTNLAVLKGTGKGAVMHPEMEVFTRRYGFQFRAHEIGHSDRKAGEERGFWTVETNFFPGRDFASMADLNAQGHRWATEIMANRMRAKTKLVPAQAFEEEKTYLRRVPPDLPAPYQPHDRTIDQYGYVAFEANSYWVPSGAIGDVKVLGYARAIKVYQGRRLLAEYPLPPEGTRDKIFPEDREHIAYRPRHNEGRSADEEKALRARSEAVGAYLDFILKGQGALRHRTIRQLHGLFRRLSPALFDRVIARAQHYGVDDVRALDEIARLLARDDAEFVPEVITTGDCENKEEYLEGRMTDPPSFDSYNHLTPEDDDG